MVKFTSRKFLVALITFASLACSPNSGFAQRSGGSHGGGGFGPGAFRGIGPGASGGPYGRSRVYSGASQNRMFGGTRGHGATGLSPMSRGAPNASGQRSFANADGQWHSFSASRGGSVSHVSGNGTVSPRSSSGESEWRYFGNHSDSSSPSSQGPTAAHQPSSSPSGTSANAAATGSALKSVAPSGSSGFGSNSALGSSRFGSNLVSSNLRPFSTFQANRNGLASGFNAGIGTGTVGRFSFNTVSVNHFGFGCFGCGVSFSFGVGFGFGWPWGWSSWWGPGWGWGWWNPFWFTPWYYPWGWNWGYYPPPRSFTAAPTTPTINPLTILLLIRLRHRISLPLHPHQRAHHKSKAESKLFERPVPRPQ